MAKKKNQSGAKPETDPTAPASPTSRPEMIQEIGALVKTIRHTASAVDPLVGKLTPEQIEEIIRTRKEEVQRQSADQRFSQILLVIILALVLGFVGLLWATALAYNKPELVVELLKILAGMVGGYGVGYGVKSVAQAKAKR
jgi:hypothetical protein